MSNTDTHPAISTGCF